MRIKYNDERPRDDSFFYVGINLNISGEFDSFSVGGGSGNASVYYNVGEGYADWIFTLQSDSRGSGAVYPEMYLIGGIGLNALGKNVGRLNYNSFKQKSGQFGVPGQMVTRPNFSSQTFKIHHWPWNR